VSLADGRGDSPKPWCCGDPAGQAYLPDRTIRDARRQFLSTAAANAARAGMHSASRSSPCRYTVKTIAVGTGAALAMGEKGDADVLLVHAPKAEEAYMADGRGLSRQLVMHNRFIVVGPAADPANVRGATSAVDAFARIAASGAPFVSRELELWQAPALRRKALRTSSPGAGKPSPDLGRRLDRELRHLRCGSSYI
jgi:hypothetical protein